MLGIEFASMRSRASAALTCEEESCGTSELQPTSCAVDMIGYINQIIGTINAIPEPLSSRTAADQMSCPADIGVGESHLNVFSFVGPLEKSCNRVNYVDDCSEPERSNYWVGIVDDRRANAGDPYTFGVVWGDDWIDYFYDGSCEPDLDGYDNAAAGIPKVLQPVSDVDGDGLISYCAPAPGSSGYVAVGMLLKQPADIVIAYVETNVDGLDTIYPRWVTWKQPALCAP
jgi:hypothetical protein